MLRSLTRTLSTASRANKYGPNGMKATTAIPGLPVVPHARKVLIALYTQTLEELKVLPENNHYRKAVESISKFRRSVCEENECIQKIEDIIDNGQVEELINQGEDELELIPKYAEWKPYEVKVGDALMEEDDLNPASTIGEKMFKDPYIKALLKKDREESLETLKKNAEMDAYEKQMSADDWTYAKEQAQEKAGGHH